jgi:ABC-type bacteriocin/lantibiotic exporter with double-glycine peptidase domain
MLRDFEALQDKLFRADFAMMIYAGLVQAATFAVFAVFLWFGAQQVLAGSLTVGELVSFNARAAGQRADRRPARVLG